MPSASVLRTAEALKGLGREFNTAAEDTPSGPEDGLLQRTDAGEGIVIASRTASGADVRYSQHVRFAGAGEVRTCTLSWGCRVSLMHPSWTYELLRSVMLWSKG